MKMRLPNINIKSCYLELSPISNISVNENAIKIPKLKNKHRKIKKYNDGDIPEEEALLEEESNKNKNKKPIEFIDDEDYEDEDMDENCKKIIRKKKIVYLIKSDKKKNDIDKDKYIYIIDEDDESDKNKNKKKPLEDIFYIETEYDDDLYKKYKKIIYLKSKSKKIPRNADKRMKYIIKYNKNKQNLEEEEIIYIILEEDDKKGRIKELPMEEIEEMIKNKKIIYLLKNKRNMKEIEKGKLLYYIYGEEMIYTEIEYDIEKYRRYRKTICLKYKGMVSGVKDGRIIIYLIRYNNSIKYKYNIENEEIIYIILEGEDEEEEIINNLTGQKIIYLLNSDKVGDKDVVRYQNKIRYVLSDEEIKETQEIKQTGKTGEEIIYYMEIEYEAERYKLYRKTIYLESKGNNVINVNIANKKGWKNVTYLVRYNKIKYNIKNEKVIYIVLTYDSEDSKKEFKRTPYKTYFKFFNSRHRNLSSFNASSISQRPDNEAQKIFFNYMHKRYSLFKVFSIYAKFHDPRKRCIDLWLKPKSS